MPHSFGTVRSALRLLFRRVVAIYFREVEIAGEVPTPDTGGRLFAANHVNALVDPILVLTQAPCPISPIAKSTLWSIPGLRWLLDAADAVPIVRKRDVPDKSAKDNDAVFERVASHLAGGGNILIFPEGTSHNEPHLLALRSGAGRMLARARADAGARAESLTFQAVALEFDEREIFRSRTLVLFGPVRRVDDLARSGAEGGADAMARAITDAIRADLSEMLVEGATWEERVLLVRAAEMFANDSEERSLAQINQLGRRIEEARRALHAVDPAAVAAVERRVADYWAALEDAGATDRLVARFSRRAVAAAQGDAVGDEPTVAADRVAWAAARVVTLPLAAVGAVLWYLPYQLPRAVTRRLHGDPDVSSTYKLGVGLLVHPLWAALWIIVAYARLSPALATLAATVVLGSPFAALPWLDRWDRIAARVRLIAPSEDRREQMRALARERGEAMHELLAARDRVEVAAPGDTPAPRAAGMSGSGRLSDS